MEKKCWLDIGTQKKLIEEIKESGRVLVVYNKDK
jgi:hypothetical protein